jgi:hypothetical protein
MGTVTPGNLAMGPGTLYVGAYGAVEPDDGAVSAAPSSAVWTDVGATMGGISLVVTAEYKKLDVDQLPMSPESRRTSLTVQVKTKMAEVTLENLKYALNAADGDVSSGSGYSKYTPDLDDSSASPTYRAVIFDGLGPGGKNRRVIVRKVLSQASIEASASKEDQQSFEVTLDAHYVSSAIKPYAIIDEV